MRQLIAEAQRLQKLAGLLKEYSDYGKQSDYGEKSDYNLLNENIDFIKFRYNSKEFIENHKAIIAKAIDYFEMYGKGSIEETIYQFFNDKLGPDWPNEITPYAYFNSRSYLPGEETKTNEWNYEKDEIFIDELKKYLYNEKTDD